EEIPLALLTLLAIQLAVGALYVCVLFWGLPQPVPESPLSNNEGACVRALTAELAKERASCKLLASSGLSGNSCKSSEVMQNYLGIETHLKHGQITDRPGPRPRKGAAHHPRPRP